MLHAEVALDLGKARGAGSFTYRVPAHLPIRPGDVVLVPLSRRLLPGVVVSVAGTAPEFPTRPVEEKVAEDAFIGPLQLTLARWIAAHYRAPLFDCLALFLPPGLTARLAKAAREGKIAPRPGEAAAAAWDSAGRPRTRPAAAGSPAPRGPVEPPLVLTLPQQSAARRIVAAIEARRHTAFLLHGVTGSGKTHVYLEAVDRVLQLGRQAIVLISEIALTTELLSRFQARFPGRVAVLHSRLAPAEHRQSWDRIRRGEFDVVIGSRSALFAPVRRLGLIVLDEEHEWTYKQESSPRYHAREVALWLGQLARAPVVLGSATPDVESYFRAERNRYVLLRLPSRYPRGQDRSGALQAGARGAEGADSEALRDLPPVQVVDMRAELRAGNRSIFSRALAGALEDCLARGEQALLFLNRRGAATCVSCRDCGHVVMCRRCDVPLVYHRADDSLVCHRCNRRRPSPGRCPGCASARIRFLGVGTQRVESEISHRFPNARVARWDRDVTSRRGAHERLWSAFGRGEIDVLVGTQMIAKALDFPRVTVVGVVLADVGLFLPDFRAGERAFQLLTQMAGRTGRGPLGGRAIVQTYAPDHYAIQAAAHHDYAAFYRHEIAFRRAHGYPPVGRIVRLIYTGSGELRCARETSRVRRLLDEEIARQGIGDIQVLGPAPCFNRRVRGRERWQVLLRGDRFARLLDRVELPPGWTVDVDPASLL